MPQLKLYSHFKKQVNLQKWEINISVQYTDETWEGYQNLNVKKAQQKNTKF